MHGDVPGSRGAFQLVEEAEAGIVREVDVEQYRAWAVTYGCREPIVRRLRDDALEAHLVRQIAQDAGKPGIVFHDQDRSRCR
jgi:hypothetical protein